MKSDTAKAFRRWAQTNYKIVETNLKFNLKLKEDERKTKERQGKQEK